MKNLNRSLLLTSMLCGPILGACTESLPSGTGTTTASQDVRIQLDQKAASRAVKVSMTPDCSATSDLRTDGTSVLVPSGGYLCSGAAVGYQVLSGGSYIVNGNVVIQVSSDVRGAK